MTFVFFVLLCRPRPATASAPMDSQTLGAVADDRAQAQRHPVSVHALLAVAALAAIVVALRAILPLLSAVGLLAVLAWFAVPGVLLAYRLYGSKPGAWPAALL